MVINWIKKHKVLVVCGALLFTPAALNYSGMCISQGRWFHKEELAFVAVSAKAYGSEMLITQTDEAVWDYVRNSPYCCQVNLTTVTGPVDFLSRVINFTTHDIYFTYEMKKERGGEKYFEVFATLDNCGHNLHSIGGTQRLHPPIRNNSLR